MRESAIRLGSVQGQTGRDPRSYEMPEFNLSAVLGLLGRGSEIRGCRYVTERYASFDAVNIETDNDVVSR